MTKKNLDEQFEFLLWLTVTRQWTYADIEWVEQNANSNPNENIEVDGEAQYQKVKEWNSKFGYTFNIYSNEHLIEGKKHFHFDNKAEGMFSKIDFDGNVLEQKGKDIPSNILKDLKYFLSKIPIKTILEHTWKNRNPNL